MSGVWGGRPRAAGGSAGASCLGLLAGVALAVVGLAAAGSEFGLGGAAGAGVLLWGGWLLATRTARRAAAQRARLVAQVGNPRRLRGVWRRELRRAWGAYDAYQATVGAMPEGPLRDRLCDTGRQVHAGLVACGALARHGAGLETSLKRFRPRELRRQLTGLRWQQLYQPAADVAAAVSALERQLASAEALQRQTDQLRRRLQLHSNALGEVAARAALLAVRAGDVGGQQPADSVDDLHHDLAALVDAAERLPAQPSVPLESSGTRPPRR